MKTDTAVKVLNEMYHADPKATRALMGQYTPVSPALASHPTIQCGPHPANRKAAAVRLIGVINGILGADGQPLVETMLDDRTNELVGFRIGKPAKDYEQASGPPTVTKSAAVPVLRESLAEAAQRLERDNAKAERKAKV